MTTAPLERTPRWIVPGLAAVLLLGALLRGAYLRDLRADPLFLRPNLDAELHDYWARALTTGNWAVPQGRHDPAIRTTPFFRPPGYPYVLAAEYALTGGDPTATRVVQFGLGLCTALLGFVLARRLGGPVAGLATAFGMAVSWPMIFFEGELLDSCVLAPAILGALLLLDRAAARPSVGRGLAAGVLLGAAALVRPNVLAFVPLAVAWLAWAGSRRAARPPALRAAAVMAAGVVLAVLPATLRNVSASGEWVLVSSNGGINLLIGNNPDADGVHAAVPGIEKLAGLSGWTCFDYPMLVRGLSRQVGRPVGYAEASRIWAAEAWRWIAGHPARFAALTAKRAALFFGPAEIGDRDVDLAREASPVLRAIPGRFPWVLAAALVGFGLLLPPLARGAGARGETGDRREALSGSRVRGETALLLALFVALYAASFFLFFVNSRYRIPVLAVLYVPAGVAIATAAGRLGAGDRKGAARIAVGGVALAALLSIDPVRVPHPLDDWHYQRACAYRNAGRPDAAIAEYREAIRSNPSATRARNDLALVLRSEGRVGAALAEWDAALASDPHAVEPRFNRAQTLAAMGRMDEAIGGYRGVLADDPGNVHAHLSLGTALVATGRLEEGRLEYRRARDLAPDDALVAFVLGRFDLSRGRRAEGIAELERSLRLDPGNAAARQALASARAAGTGAAGPSPGTEPQAARP